VPKIADEPWAAGVFDAWKANGVHQTVMNAIRRRKANGNVAV
jgi:hypothetical protein